MFNFLAIVLMLFLSIVAAKLVLTTLYFAYCFFTNTPVNVDAFTTEPRRSTRDGRPA